LAGASYLLRRGGIGESSSDWERAGAFDFALSATSFSAKVFVSFVAGAGAGGVAVTADSFGTCSMAEHCVQRTFVSLTVASRIITFRQDGHRSFMDTPGVTHE
jgi:hypothetical protein